MTIQNHLIFRQFRVTYIKYNNVIIQINQPCGDMCTWTSNLQILTGSYGKTSYFKNKHETVIRSQ